MLIGNTCLTEKHLFMFFFTFTLKCVKYHSRTIWSQTLSDISCRFHFCDKRRAHVKLHEGTDPRRQNSRQGQLLCFSWWRNAPHVWAYSWNVDLNLCWLSPALRECWALVSLLIKVIVIEVWPVSVQPRGRKRLCFCRASWAVLEPGTLQAPGDSVCDVCWPVETLHV